MSRFLGGWPWIVVPVFASAVSAAPVFHLTEDLSAFPNPERGFYAQFDLDTLGDAADGLRAEGMTLVLGKIPLAAYRTRTRLPSAFLARVQAGFDRARQAGVKVIVRADYGFAGPGGDYTTYSDPNYATILGHITQLRSLFAANADVIALFQAGFVGPWGEWHTTALSRDVTRRRELLSHLLDNTPTERMVVVRSPALKRSIFQTLAPINEAVAHDGGHFSRTGHHNDCLLSSPDDVGTYGQEGASMADELEYLGEETSHTPFGGESCALHERSEAEPALFELEHLHATYLNSGYHLDVLGRWRGNGVMAEAERRLGARLVVTGVELPAVGHAGRTFTVRLSVANRGFASLYNARPVALVLIAPGGVRHRFALSSADPRRWPAGRTTEIVAEITLPVDLAAGSHAWALHLPDASSRLASDSRYAWRLANLGAWDAGTGENRLVDGWPVAEAYPATYAEWVSREDPANAGSWKNPASPAHPEADAAGDGWTNLHRYGFGVATGERVEGNPLRIGARSGAVGGSVLTFRLPAPRPAGLRYALERSGDLVDWTELDLAGLAVEPVAGSRYWYDEYTLPIEAGGRRFYRMRLTLPAE